MSSEGLGIQGKGIGHNFEAAMKAAAEKWRTGNGYNEGNGMIYHLKDKSPVRLTSIGKRDNPAFPDVEYTVVRTDQIPTPIGGGAYSYIIQDKDSNTHTVWDYDVELDFERA